MRATPSEGVLTECGSYHEKDLSLHDVVESVLTRYKGLLYSSSHNVSSQYVIKFLSYSRSYTSDCNIESIRRSNSSAEAVQLY